MQMVLLCRATREQDDALDKRKHWFPEVIAMKHVTCEVMKFSHKMNCNNDMLRSMQPPRNDPSNSLLGSLIFTFFTTDMNCAQLLRDLWNHVCIGARTDRRKRASFLFASVTRPVEVATTSQIA